MLPVLFMTACVETIVMDSGEEDLPVMVNCIMNTDLKVQTLYLQFVKGKSQKEYIPITEAKVYVAADISSSNHAEFQVSDFILIKGNSPL